MKKVKPEPKPLNVADVLRALKRAHLAARRIAKLTGTEVIYFENGQLVRDTTFVRKPRKQSTHP